MSNTISSVSSASSMVAQRTMNAVKRDGAAAPVANQKLGDEKSAPSAPKENTTTVSTERQSTSETNQREVVEAMYEGRSDAPKAAAPDVENARNEVKRLYEETSLEETQRVQSSPADSRSAISPEQQRVKEELKLLGAMAQDKAQAQVARIEKSRAATRERIHLNTQRKFAEHFEAFSLAQEMIALKDRNLDRQEGQLQAKKAMEQTTRSDVQMSKIKSDQSRIAFQARNQKDEAAVARRLDIITPGSFEPPKAAENTEKPTVQINRNLRQQHTIELNPGRAVGREQSRRQAELDRAESSANFDSTLAEQQPESSRTTESVREALEGLKTKASENGFVALNSQSQAQRAAEDVLIEARQRPEQSIQSQSQISLQAALKVLQ